MSYHVKQINSKKELDGCPTFYVSSFNWNGDYRPVTYGRLAFLREEGFLLKMICEEKEPLRIYKKANDPVYQDSAMEAFFCFKPQENGDSLYMNFEANANGALLIQQGYSREDREFLTEKQVLSCQCRGTISKNSWSVEFLIPLPLIADICGVGQFHAGDTFTCNFYKICELNSPLEHYASCFPIHSPNPDFHLPQFFGKAVIQS